MKKEMSTTPGEWIVITELDKPVEGIYLHKVMADNQLVALVPNLADAALFATSKNMLDALIAIQETLTTSKSVIDLEKVNAMIGEVFEKIAVEAGEI